MEDGLRPSVEAGRDRLWAELEDGIDDGLVDLVGTGGWSVRLGLQGGGSVAPVTGQQLVEPAARDRVLTNQIGWGSVCLGRPPRPGTAPAACRHLQWRAPVTSVRLWPTRPRTTGLLPPPPPPPPHP